jgi:beta-N-acetylhexosaminidase
MRNKSVIFLIIILFVITILMAINYFFKPFYKEMDKINDEIESDIEQMSELDEKIKALEQMTSAEKVAQVMAVPLVINEDPQATFSAGFIILFGKNIASQSAKLAVNQVLSQYHQSIFYPLIMVDHEGGVVQRLNGKGFTKLPSWQQMCNLEASESAEIFKKSAEELANVGVNIVLAPVVDLGKNSVLKSRVCEDQKKLANTAKSFIINFGQYNIMSVIKHFPGLGSITKDPHYYYEETQINADDTRMFRDLLDIFPNLGVMTAHIGVKDRFEGLPCSLSKDCLTGFVNSYPESLIFVDALDMKSVLLGGVASPRSLTEVSKQAVLAGNDVLLYGEAVKPAELSEVLVGLVLEYENSEEFKLQINKSLEKIINLKKLQK